MTAPLSSTAYPSVPAAPTQAPEGYVTPGTLSAGNKPPMTGETVEAYRGNFIELILREVVRAVTGFFFPGAGGAFDQLVDWATNIGAELKEFIEGIFGGVGYTLQQLIKWFRSLGGFFPTLIDNLDGTGGGNVLGQVVDGLNGTADFIHDQLTNVVEFGEGIVMGGANALDNLLGNTGIIEGLAGAFINGINGLFGIGKNASPAQVNEAAFNLSTSLAAMAAAISELQSTGGTGYFVDFSGYPDAPSLGADFTQIYSGAGASTLGAKDGRAFWEINDDRRGIAIYDTGTATVDNQKVSCTLASAPGSSWVQFENRQIIGRNLIVGRSNLAATTYVYVELLHNRVELGCFVSGVKTVFMSKAWTVKAGSTYSLVCGTPSGSRVFELWENGIKILTFTDASAVSQLGVSNRYGGFGGQVDTYTQYIFFVWFAFHVGRPGNVAAFSLADSA